jgi:hypothetical protein
MANSKISALPAATTPLAGTELVPVVQGGITEQVSVANLTAGRAVSAASLALTTSPLPVTSGGTGTATAFTLGSVVFAGTSGVYSQNNTNYFWDNTNNRLGLGTASPTKMLNVIIGAVAGRQNLDSVSRTSQNLLTFTNPQYSTDASMGIMFRSFPQSDARQGAGIFASGGSGNNVTDLNLFVSGLGGADTTYSAVYIEGVGGDATVRKGNLVVGTSGKGIDFSSAGGGFIGSTRGQVSSSGGSTTTLFTLANVSSNQIYQLSVRQSGGVSNTVIAQILSYGASANALRIAQDNTNPVLDMNITTSGLAVRLVIGSGFGTTTWDWVLTRLG